MSLPSGSSSRSSTVHSLSGKTQGLKFMQRASLKKQDDNSTSFPSTSKRLNPDDTGDSAADSSFQSNTSFLSPANESFEQWFIPPGRARTITHRSNTTRFQPESAWNSWHLNSQGSSDDDPHLENQTEGQANEDEPENNFVSDSYRPPVGNKRKRYGQWAIPRGKKSKRSDADQADEAEDSEQDLSRDPLLDDEEEEEERKGKSNGKAKPKKSVADSSSNTGKFLKPGGDQTGIKKKSSQNLLPKGARKQANTTASSSSLGEFKAQQSERDLIRSKKREQMSKGKHAKARRRHGFHVPNMDEEDDDYHFESRELDSGGL